MDIWIQEVKNKEYAYYIILLIIIYNRRQKLRRQFFLIITFELKKMGTSSLKHLKAAILGFKMPQTRSNYRF